MANFDLRGIFIYSERNGRRVPVSCYDADDQDFDRWAHLMAEIDTDGMSSWTIKEREDFIKYLLASGVPVYEMAVRPDAESEL